ncbi:hypothetical protein [Streptomyces sp. NPDC058268]|uniref:hypothetical protein n=1 Tax=Streptomyces sp. NPDC058268 TaxID=3346413 RepID=UPI0036E7F298
MPYLTYETVTHHVVDRADLEQCIVETFGRRYNTAMAVDVLGVPVEGITADGNLRDVKTARRWVANGGAFPHPRVLLNALVHQGLVEPGDFLVKCTQELQEVKPA